MDFKKIIDGGEKVYFIGIKGTGMSALAELLHGAGGSVSGSDTGDIFYTDAILKELGIPYYESFDAAHIPADAALVIHSAAYGAEDNVEVACALQRGLPLIKYTDALGEYSALFDSTGIAGVHGKTTTTALAGALVMAQGLAAQVLAGSAVSTFNGHSTISLGNKYFIAETCEYRKHFLSFHPRRIILTSIESDHQDFYPTYDAIFEAFLEYARLLPEGGELIYCADDPGAAQAAALIKKERGDLQYTPYGRTASGDYKIESCYVENERVVFKLSGIVRIFTLHIPGEHNVLNATAALALLFSLLRKERGDISGPELESIASSCEKALEGFRGSKRRAEFLGEAAGILFMDDYAQHPTAINTTLAGLKKFYPSRRLVVSFMPHTYTRTAALLDEFSSAFNDADLLLLHKIYASAREKNPHTVSGEALFEKAKRYSTNAHYIHYFNEYNDSIAFLQSNLKEGDLFLTMGAGDNWQLGKKLFELYKENQK
jgi:UDP-N-acetylmuramate--alanine ligase